MEIQHAGNDIGRDTTRGLTPGLIDPLAGPDSSRIPVPEWWLRPRPQRAADVDRVVQNTARKRRAMTEKETQQRLSHLFLGASDSAPSQIFTLLATRGCPSERRLCNQSPEF